MWVVEQFRALQDYPFYTVEFATEAEARSHAAFLNGKDLTGNTYARARKI